MTLDPDPVHDWIYVEDFVSGMMVAAENAKHGEIVNIGTGREVSNQYVINALQNVTGKTLKFKQAEARPNDSNHWSADISKLLGWGWRAKFPLGLGLAKTAEWYKANGPKAQKATENC